MTRKLLGTDKTESPRAERVETVVVRSLGRMSAGSRPAAILRSMARNIPASSGVQ
jgi:hypothetical protein